MSIERFVEEIQNRKKNDLAELDKKLNDKKSETDAKKNSAKALKGRRMGPGPDESPTLRDQATKIKKWKSYQKKYGG